jgi:membrane-bound metal-dependent hydrolase YbcI (DUF457 family)
MLLLLRACMFTQDTESVVIHRGFTHSIWGRACILIIQVFFKETNALSETYAAW